MEELNLYIDYINTKDLYLIQLYKINENGEVLEYLERYTTHNIHSAVNKAKEIADRYAKVTIISEYIYLIFSYDILLWSILQSQIIHSQYKKLHLHIYLESLNIYQLHHQRY